MGSVEEASFLDSIQQFLITEDFVSESSSSRSLKTILSDSGFNTSAGSSGFGYVKTEAEVSDESGGSLPPKSSRLGRRKLADLKVAIPVEDESLFSLEVAIQKTIPQHVPLPGGLEKKRRKSK